jgi:DNA-binding response OmpR family regulator
VEIQQQMNTTIGTPAVAIVEANPTLCATLSNPIRAFGFTVECAENSRHGLELAKGAGIVLVDLILDDMDGLSFIEELRSLRRDVHIIAVMADLNSCERLDMDTQTIQKMAMQSGANAVFLAPFNLGALLGTIENFSRTDATESAA